MDAFLSFYGPGFWLVLTLLVGVIVLGLRPYLPRTVQQWRLPGYWVLLPYMALLAGGVSPRLMGVIYIDWRTTLTLGVGLALTTVTLAAVARIALLPRPRDVDDAPSLAPDLGALASSIAVNGAEEWFWSFLRGAVAETLLLTQFSLDTPAYWSIWIAAALALPFALLQQSNLHHRLVKSAILVMTSILFFFTRNFWLCWAVHATIWLLLAQPAAMRVASTGRSQAQRSPQRGWRRRSEDSANP